MSESESRALPPLPQHPPRGMRVEAGDTFVITQMSLEVHDATDIEGDSPRSFPIRVPPLAGDYAAGATFGLSRRLEEGHYNVDGNRVDIVDNGWAMEVALKKPPPNLLKSAFGVADRTLDILAAEGFLVSDLDDPLREYALWFRENGRTVLRTVSTSRLAFSMKIAAEVRDPSGTVKPQPLRPTMRWHPSHAYFRRSQATDSLHEAYRYLFLALEALLSEVFPWESKTGESAWLQDALRYVAEGYSLDLAPHVGGPGGNPYKRFIKEQYRARRCALFHAKLSEGPLLPGDFGTRSELMEATHRLGQLYVKLARLITGAGFAGGAMSHAGFAQVMDSQAKADLYISSSPDFDIVQAIRSPGHVVLNATGQQGVHELRGFWNAPDFPELVARAGSLIPGEAGVVEGLYTPLDLCTTGVDSLEIVFQYELANARNLREWYL